MSAGLLHASGSSDLEDDAIISYEWDFNFDGTYDVSTANHVVALTVATSLMRTIPNGGAEAVFLLDDYI